MDNLCKPCNLAVFAVVLAAIAHGYLLVTGKSIEDMAWSWPFLAGIASKYLTGGTDEPV
jgi:hypothetical protein